jgi:hypothetical protein
MRGNRLTAPLLLLCVAVSYAPRLPEDALSIHYILSFSPDILAIGEILTSCILQGKDSTRAWVL